MLSDSKVPRILVVDDDELILCMYKEFFDEIGCEIYACSDGESALDVADKVKPDIFVIDMRLPGISGLELMKKMRVSSPDAEFIVISGFGRLDDSIVSFREGAADFLTKPIQLDDMVRAYNNALKRTQARRMEPVSKKVARKYVEGLMVTQGLEMDHLVESINEKINKMIYPQIDMIISNTKNKETIEDLTFLKKLLSALLPFSTTQFLSLYEKLTPIEIRICNSICQWKSTQEISEALNMSVYTVYDHQKRIRMKLGLTGQGKSLGNYLRSRMNSDNK